MRNRKTLFASLFIALFLCTMPNAFAKVWYVKTTGNNANSGASEALAKASIQAMLNSTSVVSGDTILVWGGTYQEQVITGNISVTIIGSIGGSRTLIQAPAWASMQTFTFSDAMNWNGNDGRLSSSKLKPIVFANASSSSILTNIRGIDIDGSTANMPENATEVFAGLAYRQSQGLIGGVGDSTYNEVRNITPTSNSNALNNTVGILFIERAKPTMKNTRVVNFRNIGIGSIGMNTSALQTVQDHQPSPIIENCIVQGEDGGTTSSNENVIQAGLVVANGARVNITKSHIYGNRSGNAGGDRIAYGIYLWNARNTTIGHNTVKSNGNVISDNELAIHVRVTVSSLNPELITIKNNNIVYNGGTASNLGTAAGKVADYASSTASFISHGAVRFSHSSNFAQTLNVSNNAWGNAEASMAFSSSNAGYTLANYQSSPVAFWRETTNDNIVYTNALSPATTVVLEVHSNYSGSNISGAPQVDVEYGYTKFDQLNRAVFAAGIYSGTAPFLDPRINLLSNVVESGSVIITKPVKIVGSGTSCDAYPSVTLRNGLNEPTVWIYGMSHASPNSDYTDRTPVRDTLNKVRILANNVQAAGSTTDGPAVLITGTTTGTQSPVKPVMSYMSISNQFDGTTGPQAYSTSQSGTATLSMRHALLAAGPYYALYTRRPEDCNQFVGGNNVIDNGDNNLLPRFQFENIIEVANCIQLNQAIIDAEGPDFTTLLIIANIGSIGSPCEAFVNSTEPITIDVQTGSTAFIHYLLNPGAGPNYGGGSNAICTFLRTTPTSGGTHNAVRVTAYPPACLQTAVNLISSGSDNLLVAAAGSAFTDAGSVTINKAFDFMGATNATAHLASPTAGNATYTGKFVLNSSADINNVGGSLTSTRGITFGDASNQVDLNFTNTSLANFGAGTGDAINMALQLINSTSGSRRMELTTSTHSTETPTISKRVYLNGLANRGTTVGLITLNGSGNCTDPSVLRNLSAATITVNSDADCIQTALGIANCTTYTQNIEGVGTNATNGSGGTVNLNNVAYTQNVDISKSVTFTNSATTNGTVTLRRGANLLGGLSNFATTVNLEQCVAFANATKPDPQQAITIVNNSGSGVVNIAGYGEANSNDLTTPAPNGVWAFSNIDVNKDIEIRGNYHSTSATNLSCANIAGSTVPAISASRNANLETVIGTFHSSPLVITSPIFKVNSNGVSIKGFKLRNVVSASALPFVQVNSTSSNIEVLNNIVTGSGVNPTVGLVYTSTASNKSNIDITDNHFSPVATTHQAINIANLTDGPSVSSLSNNVIDGANIATNAIDVTNITNSTSNGLTISNNWARCFGTSIQLNSTVSNTLDGITIERNNFRSSQNGIVIFPSGAPGINGITIRENYINNNTDGIEIFGSVSSMPTNQIFINNNNLALNTNGVFIPATTAGSGSSDNFLDLRFNYWGSDLGPVRGTNVASAPLFAPSDSVKTIGYVPFEHTTGSRITDGSTNGRWMIYPVAVTGTDGNSGTCGWQYGSDNIQAGVLRVNAAGNTLLGMYNTISNARDDVSRKQYPASGARTGTDQIFVIAQSTDYNSNIFGYNGSVESEGSGSYPIVFSADPQPSVIRGINRPTITTDESGSISVASTFPSNFTIKDYISHVSTTTGAYTGISFANPHSNRVEDNFITSTVAAPAKFTGISTTHSGSSKAQNFNQNKINLGQDPRWDGGPSAAVSAPLEFTGIEILSHGASGSVTISSNDISTASTSSATKSVGIFVNAGTNITSMEVNRNQIRGMAANASDVAARTSIWGTGIYVRGGDNINITENDIQGGNTGGTKAHDGITLDASGIARTNIKSNMISTSRSFSGLNMTGNRERGYGVKLFSSTGTGNIGGAYVWNNTFGSSTTTAPGVASFYVGGTSGTVGSGANDVRFSVNFIYNSVESTNAAIQVATSQYTGTASAGYVTIDYTDFGFTVGHSDNSMFLAIGTTGNGGSRNTQADNYAVNVFNNDIRVAEQTVASSTIEVADGRPNAGANIRNIFGYGNGSTLNGSASTLGGGRSGINTFSFATILTGEAGLATYTTALNRTGDAIAYPNSTDPVVISRLIASPLQYATSSETRNTVELRENAGWSSSTENSYYKETLNFPNQRILISGPSSSTNGNAELLPGSGGTGIMFTSTGRENKDIRGAIRFNAIGAGLFGKIGTAAADKGDVYVQLSSATPESGLSFRYHASSLGSLANVTGLGNGTTRATDIKAGMDDADDDSYTANASSLRRTGVFRSGNVGTQFTKDNTNDAITGVNMLNVYPNPASGDVTVAFKVPVPGMVRVALYNSLGQKVTDLREENLNADIYTTVFNAASLTNGTYHVRLVHDQFTLTTPVTIIK